MPRLSHFLLGLLIFSVGISTANAQIAMPIIPAMRQLHHEYIIRSLDQIDSLPINPAKLSPSEKEKAKNRIKSLRASIELNERLNNNDKFKWLRGVNELLVGFISSYQSRMISAEQYPVLISNFDSAMQLDWSALSIEPIIKSNSIIIGSLLVDNFALKNKTGNQ